MVVYRRLKQKYICIIHSIVGDSASNVLNGAGSVQSSLDITSTKPLKGQRCKNSGKEPIAIDS